jgi:hypothetical protein
MEGGRRGAADAVAARRASIRARLGSSPLGRYRACGRPAFPFDDGGITDDGVPELLQYLDEHNLSFPVVCGTFPRSRKLPGAAATVRDRHPAARELMLTVQGG